MPHDPPEPDARPPKLWHVLQTMARQEKALADDLAALNVEHYLPLQSSVRYYGRRRITTDLPVFPGYLFLHGTLDDAYRADRTRRVARILAVGDQTRLGNELSNVRAALGAGAVLCALKRWRAGTRAVVRAGPLQGIEGEVEDPVRPDRLILRINMLGQAVSLEIDPRLLEPLDAVRRVAA